jgi:para-aminobenzoate synthetase component 2
MAIAHESLPIVGVQFHPESVLTEDGHRLLANWLAGVRSAAAQPAAVQ